MQKDNKSCGDILIEEASIETLIIFNKFILK